MSNVYIENATARLEKLARSLGKPIFYSELSQELNIAARSMGGVLKPISKHSHETRGVLLSVLVVSKETGLPSQEFFEQAKQLLIMSADALPQEFFRAELQRVYDAYKQG